jgi:trimeric autotransporter adhesin
MPTINGTVGNDSLDGGAGDDLITGIDGADTLHGADGADTLDGGIGDDWLYGDGGDDRIIANGGYDHVDGGTGVNTLVIDFAAATSGVSNASSNIIYQGNSGYRVDFSNIQNFDFTGSAFADNVAFSSGGDDTVRGGAGNDILNTGAGLAIVDGGADNDTWSANLSAATGPGVLDLRLAGTQTFDGCTITGIEAVNLTGGSGAETIRTRTGAANLFNENIDGGGGDDVIGVGGGYDTVDGGLGDNTLIVDFSETTGGIISGQGVSTSGYFYQGNDTYRVAFNNIQHFNATGGAQNDTFNLSNDADTVDGGGGDDILNTGQGAATVEGGLGNDRWAADLSSATANGVLDLTKAQSQVFDGSTIHGVEALYLTAGSGDETIITRSGSAYILTDSIYGGDGNDTIGVGGGNDTVDGGAGLNQLIVNFADATAGIISGQGVNQNGYFYQGNDTFRVNFFNFQSFVVTGSAQSDTFNLGSGADTFSGGDGDDFVNTGAGTASVNGGLGNDTWAADLSTTATANGVLDLSKAGKQTFDDSQITAVESLRVTGGSGNEKIVTLSGDAYLLADMLNGGLGNDTLGVGGGYDTVDGGDGTDTLLVNFAEADAAIFGNGSTYFYQGNNGYRVDYSNVEAFDFTGSAFADNVTFLGGDDRFIGGDGDDTVNTAAGRVTIDGGAGIDTWGANLSADTAAATVDLNKTGFQQYSQGQVKAVEAVSLTMGSGADKVLTLTGADQRYRDTINGGAGNDTLSGGSGYDQIDGGDDTDRLIADFSQAENRISGNGSTYFYQGNDNYRIDYANIETFDFTGSAFNDTVTLGAGDDIFRGLDGDDYVNMSTGLATIDGGAGNDTWAADLSVDTSGGTLDLSLAGVQHFDGGTVSNIEAVGLTTGSGADKVLTLTGAAHLFNDTVNAGFGDDTIGVGGGYDLVNGGDGTDKLIVDFSGATSALSGSPSAFLYQGNNAVRVDFSNIEIFSITGGAFNDNISTLAGNDWIDGGAGSDTLGGAGGDDTLVGGIAGDTLDGGTENDTASYITAGAGVAASLAAPGSNTGDAAGDSYSSIENLAGSAFDDSLTGDGGDNVLTGAGGNDTLDGGLGSDTANYSTAPAAVTVSLGIVGPQNTGGAGTDTLTGIENLIGSRFNDTLAGSAGDNVLNGGDGIDTLSYAAASAAVTVSLALATAQNTGSAGTDTVLAFENLTGSAFADTLTGDDGANSIDGGAGVDTLAGGLGNDTYVVDAGADVVTEAAGAAAGLADLVQASVDYVLGANVENLILTGSDGIDGTGNGSANTITGNGGANILLGAGGADTLYGGGGADTLNGGTGADSMAGGGQGDLYIVDSLGDTVTEIGGGTDTVQSSVNFTLGDNVENLLLTGADNLTGTGNTLANAITGNASNNTLLGGGGNDTLDGGVGADSMTGGAGADLFIVDNGGDIVSEGADADIDTVQTALNYTLTANVENLVLTGAANRSGVGNASNNTITGNSGANLLNGAGGADTLRGGAGDDTYEVDAADTIVELAGGGTDTVRASINYTLGSEVENLVLLGAASLTGTGNKAANVMSANNAGDSLFGAAGADTLNGGTGADTLNGGVGIDSMAGGAGADLYVVDDAADVIKETASSDIDSVQASASYVLSANLENLLLTGSAPISGTGNLSDNLIEAGGGANSLLGLGGADTLRGGGGADTLDGGANADVLDGGTGADRLIGGNGGDIYYVDDAGDAVFEAASGGVDTVMSSISLTLAGEVENLELLGFDTLSGTGNALDNVLKGNGKDNVLNGGLGNDTLSGGKGQDTASYAGSTSGVTVSLLAAGAQNTGAAGVDTLVSIEFLTGSSFNDSLTGDNKGNLIIGGGGADTITGGGRADLLTGGAGADTFVFASAFESGRKSADTITDIVDADTIDLGAIDADAVLGGDQAFSLVSAFDGHAGQLVVSYDAGAGVTSVSGDTDGDGKADLLIKLTGDHGTFSHFVF